MSRKQTAILSICRSLFVYFGRRVKVARVAIHGKLVEQWILKGHGLHTATKVRLFTAKLNIQQVTPFRADKIQRNPVAERLSFVFFMQKPITIAVQLEIFLPRSISEFICGELACLELLYNDILSSCVGAAHLNILVMVIL